MDPSIIDRVLELVVKIQQIPAPTFVEYQRAEFIQRHFLEVGIKDVFIDGTGNVYALIRGHGEKPPLVVSAHMDTVFPADTNLAISRTPEKITGAGIGDNSLGLAGLFGLYWALCDTSIMQDQKPFLAGDIWLVANVCEEGLGNLKGMKAVVNRFGGEALAFLVLEGMSLGYIYHRGLGVKRYRITVHTKGGHSWVDFGTPSAIHELADLVVKIKNLDFPIEPRTSFNIGVISGGTSVNTIAAEASLQLDLRSISTQALDMMSDQVEALVDLTNKKGGENIHVGAEVIGERPAGEIPEDHPLVKLAVECHAVNGLKAKLNIGSTDANEPLSRGLPAICLGLTTGGGSHTTAEYIDVKPVGQGLGILVDLVHAVFREGIDSHPL
jgi:acetylornithine deacetylase/succinyl-diaminopimelate desuccinylase-like protein